MDDRAAEKCIGTEGYLKNETNHGYIHKMKNLEKMDTFLDSYD